MTTDRSPISTQVWVDELRRRDRGTFVFMKDVTELTGLPDTYIRSLVQRGEFPEPVRLDGRRLSFVLGEVIDWLAEVKTAKRSREMRPDLQEGARRGGAIRGQALRQQASQQQ